MFGKDLSIHMTYSVSWVSDGPPVLIIGHPFSTPVVMEDTVKDLAIWPLESTFTVHEASAPGSLVADTIVRLIDSIAVVLAILPAT